MRSSRHKRSQYVVSLRKEVTDLQQRKKEALEENALLTQLSGLWERLCAEVEEEIQEGVKRKLGFEGEEATPTPIANAATPSNVNVNSVQSNKCKRLRGVSGSARPSKMAKAS